MQRPDLPSEIRTMVDRAAAGSSPEAATFWSSSMALTTAPVRSDTFLETASRVSMNSRASETTSEVQWKATWSGAAV